MPISWLDVGLLTIVFISGFLAMLRGLTREVLSITAWAVAALAAAYAMINYQEVAQQYIQPKILALGVVIGGTFIVTLIVVTLITMKFSASVLDSRIGALDRTLGFVFGSVRGLILVVIAYLLFSMAVQEDNHPRWIVEAKFLPLIKSTGEVITSLMPEDPSSFLPKKHKPGEGT